MLIKWNFLDFSPDLLSQKLRGDLEICILSGFRRSWQVTGLDLEGQLLLIEEPQEVKSSQGGKGILREG